MQKAGNLSSQYGRVCHISERTSRIEKLALELRRDRVPLHDDSRPKAPKNMLLHLGDSISLEWFSSGSVRIAVSRTDHLVKTICQPGLILREFGKTLLRTLQFPDFARNIGMSECFGDFSRLFSKLFGRKHESPFRAPRADSAQ